MKELERHIAHLEQRRTQMLSIPGFTVNYPGTIPNLDLDIERVKEQLQALKARQTPERGGNEQASSDANNREENAKSHCAAAAPIEPDREENGNVEATNDANKREENVKSEHTERDDYEVGYGKPPAEHQFQPGNPGGPGRPKGPCSMRRMIRLMLFDEENDDYAARLVLQQLFRLVAKGNMQAIRLVVDQGNNSRKRR